MRGDLDPPGVREVIASSPYEQSEGRSRMTVYTQPESSAVVFATGTVVWSWGLDDYNSDLMGGCRVSAAAQQITRNVLARFTTSPLTRLPRTFHTLVAMPQVQPDQRSEVLQGTLDLVVLKTLDAMGPLHGYGIACRLEQISGAVLQPNQGTVYASLVRLQQRGWISAAWGTSDNNRRAKFYTITPRGRRQLRREAADWERMAGAIARVLALPRTTD